jgi:membrane protease YdiL (CAAX protease family)
MGLLDLAGDDWDVDLIFEELEGRLQPPRSRCFTSHCANTRGSTRDATIDPDGMANLPTVFAAILTLFPLLAAAFFPVWFAAGTRQLPTMLKVVLPASLAIPYLLVSLSHGVFRWGWFALYAALPVAISCLLLWARRLDREERGCWIDLLILLLLGLAVDLRWFEPAWTAGLSVFNKILLLDTGIYGFTTLRQLSGVGIDLRLRISDLKIGLRELALYTPIALALGLSLGFLHLHPSAPLTRQLRQLPPALLFTFFFVAVPEELFFRGWTQNLLERRIGRYPALLMTAVLFGLTHFNKRAVHFNWRYVLLAAIAGIFYGRAWRQQRRVAASAITHACVDTIWSVWLR